MANPPSASSTMTQKYSDFAPAATEIFLPPKSPLTASASPSLAPATDYFSSKSRKRQRSGSVRAHDGQQTPWTATPSWTQLPTPSDGIYDSHGSRDTHLVNERYRLAGGFDTPSIKAGSYSSQHDQWSDIECRRRMRDDETDHTTPVGHVPIFGPLARERNGVARIPAFDNGTPPASWTNYAFDLVGKVFNFGGSVVRGFYAGGGKGYDLNQSLDESMLSKQTPRSCKMSTPIPGAWQDDDFSGDFEQDNPSFTTEPDVRPSNKRRHTDRDAWVLVGTPDFDPSAPSHKRKASGTSVPRSNLAARPSASRASSRRSLAPVSRRQSSYVGSNGSPAQPIQPLSQTANKRASLAPTRSTQILPGSAGFGSPYMSPDTERLAKRQAKQDRQNDKAMASMSRKMEEMIRQAQEALGTKVSIEGDANVEDEGFVDDDWS